MGTACRLGEEERDIYIIRDISGVVRCRIRRLSGGVLRDRYNRMGSSAFQTEPRTRCPCGARPKTTQRIPLLGKHGSARLGPLCGRQLCFQPVSLPWLWPVVASGGAEEHGVPTARLTLGNLCLAPFSHALCDIYPFLYGLVRGDIH
jgi:hypothetical protein